MSDSRRSGRRARPLIDVGPLLAAPPVQRLDVAVAAVAGRLHGRPAIDRAMYALSEVANHSLLWHGINLVDAVTGPGERRRRAVRRSVVLAVEQSVVNGPVKSAVRRERPEGPTDRPHRLRTPLTSSFPSGHASAGACSAIMLTRDLGHGTLWWGLAAAVAWSRVHVGVHHASDVVAGAAVGATIATASGRLLPGSGRTDRSVSPKGAAPG